MKALIRANYILPGQSETNDARQSDKLSQYLWKLNKTNSGTRIFLSGGSSAFIRVQVLFRRSVLKRIVSHVCKWEFTWGLCFQTSTLVPRRHKPVRVFFHSNPVLSFSKSREVISSIISPESAHPVSILLGSLLRRLWKVDTRFQAPHNYAILLLIFTIVHCWSLDIHNTYT